MSHLDDVNSGIGKIRNLRNSAMQVGIDLKKQIKYIPIVKGEKDEFGENTEKYITEISENKIDKFISEMDKVLKKSETMRAAARNDDEPPPQTPQESPDSNDKETIYG